MRVLLVLAFVAILAALAAAGVFMLRGGRSQAKSGSMLRALALRVTLSVLLFCGILLSWKLGWIHPTGLPIGR